VRREEKERGRVSKWPFPEQSPQLCEAVMILVFHYLLVPKPLEWGDSGHPRGDCCKDNRTE
jgi:hypothetical protein